MESNKILLGVVGVLVLSVGWVYFPWPEPVPGAVKYSVKGSVTINGEPASGLTVRFFHEDKSLSKQDQMPVAVTNELGVFELSSFGGKDGAAEGNYAVTFFWPVNVMQPNKDRLQGKYNNPEKADFHISIPPDDTVLSSFEIELPPDEILPAEFSLDDMHKAVESGISENL